MQDGIGSKIIVLHISVRKFCKAREMETASELNNNKLSRILSSVSFVLNPSYLSMSRPGYIII
jgi:hypothetical protein